MKNYKVLRFLDRFSSIFERLGVDYPVMRRILQIKFTMDGRRTPTVMSGSQKKKEENNGFVKSLWIYAIMGAITIPFLFMKGSYLYQMSIVFSILIFMVMSSLISDFSSVFLDLKDKSIISSRPVNRRTVSFAKMIHIMIYITYITAAFAGIPLVVSFYRQGVLFSLVFLAEIILADLFIVAVTALIYLLILKFFDGEKLRDIINYVQIGLAMAITIGYQFIGRIFSFTLSGVEFVPKWWQAFFPPVWFAAPFELIIDRKTGAYDIVLSLLALIIPIFSIILYVRLMPAFERNLQKLNSYGESKKKGKGRFLEAMAKKVCFSREERLFFRFTTEMVRNEREFKLKVYPLLGLSVAMPFIVLIRVLTGEQLNLEGSRLYLMIYFCGMFLPTLIIMSRCSANYKGAWIYKTVPVSDISSVFKGTVKAMFVSLFLPAFVVTGILFMLLFGWTIFPGLIAVFLNLILYTAFSFKRLTPRLPFSEPFDIKQDDEWVGVALMFALAFLAAVQVLLSFLWYGVYLDIAAVSVAAVILWRKAFRVSV